MEIKNNTNSMIGNPITETIGTMSTASLQSSLYSSFREARNFAAASSFFEKMLAKKADEAKRREADETKRRDIAESRIIDCHEKIKNGEKNVSLDLSYLYLKGNCPDLPEGVTELKLIGNPSMNPPKSFPSTIKELNIAYNYWSELPKNLPKLKILDASHNKLTKVNASDLPEGIEDINFVTNELTEVTVPNSVKKLNVCNNKLLVRPTLANGAEIETQYFMPQRVTLAPDTRDQSNVNTGFELLAPEMNQRTGQIAKAIKDFGCEDGICTALSFKWAVEYALYGDITAFREKLFPDGILNVEELKGICELQPQLEGIVKSKNNIENYLKTYQLKYVPIAINNVKESDTHDNSQEIFHLVNRHLGYTSIYSVSNRETATGLNLCNAQVVEAYSKALKTNFTEPLQQYLLAATTPTTLIVYLQYNIDTHHMITFYTSGQVDAEGKKSIVFGEPNSGIHGLKVDPREVADNAKLANGLAGYFLSNRNPIAFKVHKIEK